MDKRNLITKIALGTAILAFLFSAVTLIRAIILGSGVVFAVIQVIGTVIIVAICAVMLYALSRETNAEDAEPSDAEERTDEAVADSVDVQTAEASMFAHKSSDPAEQPDTTDIEAKYHLDNFE